MSTPNTSPRDKILSVIKRLGKASFTKIKRAINEFHNQPGGAEQLRRHLEEMVANDKLIPHTDKSDKGKIVESYSIADSSTSNERNSKRSNSSNIRSNDSSLTVSCTLTIAIEGCPDIAHLFTSLLNADDSNNENEAEALVDDVEKSKPTVVEPLEDEPDDKPAPPMPAAPIRRTTTPPARKDTPARPNQDKTFHANTRQRSRDIEDEDEEDNVFEIDPSEIPF